MFVEIRDGRTHWIGPASQWQGSRATVRIVDGRARMLIPGLMDCHVHYSSPGRPDWITRFSDPLPEISIRAVELAEASLRSGVTTARDMGAPQGVSIKLAHMARAGEINAPNIRAAGTWIAHRGTYVSFARHFGEAHELRDAIRMEIEAGAELVKVSLSGWNEGARPKHPVGNPFLQEIASGTVEAAHKTTVQTSRHANDPAS